MLCLQIPAWEVSWACYTYLGWRSNRADKKAAACLSACRGFHTLVTARALVINRHRLWGRFGSSREGCPRWGSGSRSRSAFSFSFSMYSWSYYTIKLFRRDRWWQKSSLEVRGVEFSSWTSEQSSHAHPLWGAWLFHWEVLWFNDLIRPQISPVWFFPVMPMLIQPWGIFLFYSLTFFLCEFLSLFYWNVVGEC